MFHLSSRNNAFLHVSPILFYDCSLHEKREIVCNEKSDVYVTHRNGRLANEHTARLMFCLNAQKRKTFQLAFCCKQGIFNFEIVFSIGWSS